MTDKIYTQSGVPIRRTVDLLPAVFQTPANNKFMAAVLDPLVQPGKLDKTVGYIGRRYGKTFNSTDVYLDTDQTLRSRYQLEPAVVVKKDEKILNFYDYIDFKNQLQFFENKIDRDDSITEQDHYSWTPPIDWDKFVNYREYFWVPEGPPVVNITGQSQNIVSTYKVGLGVGSTFIFSPDGKTNNPTITLYRGQTYNFRVNAPNNGFVIRTSYDIGSLLYNPNLSYSKNQYAIYDGKLWKANTNISFTEGSSISIESADWDFVETATSTSIFDYTTGVTNSGTENGTITFSVPLDAPDVLFYQSVLDPNMFGRFIIANVETNTTINVEQEILGKQTYSSTNGVVLSNGMIVSFSGKVTPSNYSRDSWLVEGVGDKIKLVKFQDLIPSNFTADVPEILFDNRGFDAEPFDDAALYPSSKDYITINRTSQDSNPWSRYNRWFHRSVLTYSHEFNGTDFDASDAARAKRPIIEFLSNIRLFNHGTIAKTPVDFVDTFTTDVFSTIEGSQGYIVDGEYLFDGARLLVTADTDRLANNKIYEVNFINHSSGSSYRGDWDINISYRTGETVRFNGQSLTALSNSPSIKLSILSTSGITNQLKVLKNTNIKPGMAISFSGTSVGNVSLDTTYYIVSVNNLNSNSTEFTISLIPQGDVLNLANAVPEGNLMLASTAMYPTSSIWKVSPDLRQITLKHINDSESYIGECVLVKRGTQIGSMYHFVNDAWHLSQRKLSANQSPLFEVVDDDGVSYSDVSRYPASTFSGSKILSYKLGNSIIDTELGFSISYLNINNIGDITFNFDWDIESFQYELNRTQIVKPISAGYYESIETGEYGNCWIKSDKRFYQPIIDTVTIATESNIAIIDAIDWAATPLDNIYKTIIYVNGEKYTAPVERVDNKFIFNVLLPVGTVVSIKVFCNAEPKYGYYEIPIGLEKNPLNQDITTFTLGEAVDHISTAVDIFSEFNGIYPGNSNLRDITGYQHLAKRFVKHSSITPVAIELLCDKQLNVIKSVEYANNAYRNYKNNFVRLAETLEYDNDPVQFVDDIIVEMTKVKTQTTPFADSDMLGVGAHTAKVYVVEDPEIKVFALSNKFDLDTSSRRAVYIYLNNLQLVVSRDYIFNSNFGFVELLVDVSENDVVVIKEYVSTAFSYMPPTPTKLGLYKRYLPEKFLDNTYIEPINVIRGHDGSITVAYNDYRDDVILELEKRIYNNIKKTYSTEIYDIDHIFGGKYGNAVYSKSQLDSVISKQFRQWAQFSRTEFVENQFFIPSNPFTYTYSDLTDLTGEGNLPGWWRGLYNWFYDTDTPHLTPWAMLGFSEKPTWWDSEYGEFPYTSNNLILWEDIRDGIIRNGPTAGTHDRYKRPTILSHLPVDADGNLLSPIDSNLIGTLPLVDKNNDFKFGDGSPVETAWKRSSDWPFSLIIASCIMRPFEFIGENLDKNRVKLNKIGQTVCVESNQFLKLENIVIPEVGGIVSSGLINYITDYGKYVNLPLTTISEKIYGIDVHLSTRLSGFVDKTQQKYILDSKNPNAKTSSIFVPIENYNIIFNVGIPMQTVTYSGVIIEKAERGYKIYGYDNLNPVFKYYSPQLVESQLLSVGGVSDNYVEWESNVTYSNGTLIKYYDSFYRAIKSHNSGTVFEASLWKKIPALPLTGGVTVFVRTQFYKSKAEELEYGTIFTSIQDVVDFLCGYSEYLKSEGFVFDEYDTVLRETRNWVTSIKEFLFWTRHNWAQGALLSLSPAANKLTFTTSVGVAENFLDGFYDYQILKNDGNVLLPSAINVTREFQQLTVETVDLSDSIYLLKAYLVLKEHVAIFSDRTVFNDVIYDKTTGYRQNRLKSRGFRTTDWDGDYTSPGFIYDNVNITPWSPFVDYKLGDIVSYRSYNWTNLKFQLGTDTFDESKWSKLDVTPESQLLSNFDYKINQFSDYYNSDADGIGSSQRDLARHAIGYQTRDYLQEIAEDQVSQFKLYQGFIREKGTANALVKLFDKANTDIDAGIVLNEEWAFQVGRLGGTDQVSYVEFEINKGDFELNPQPIIISSTTGNYTDLYIRTDQSKFSYAPIPFTTAVNPTSQYTGITRSAGYVALNQIDYTVRTKSDLKTIDINTVPENTHFWITFDNYTWSVLRFNFTSSIYITSIVKVDTLVTVTVNRPHLLNVDDYIGIRDIDELTGFFNIVAVTDTSFTVVVESTSLLIPFDSSTISYNLYLLTNARYKSFADVNRESLTLLKTNSRIWIDDIYGDESASTAWQVLQKQTQFVGSTVSNYLITNPLRVGSAVAHAISLNRSLVGIPGSGQVISLADYNNTLAVSQIIIPASGYATALNFSFGAVLALSPDDKWLALGAPNASGIKSNFAGEFNPAAAYSIGDIVLYKGQLWESVGTRIGDGSTIDIYTEDWKPATLVKGDLSGYAGPTHQGAVFLYKWQSNQWTVSDVIVSPRVFANEYFGSSISISVSNGKYYMAVSATGAVNSTGRVYLYVYENSKWSIVEDRNYRGLYISIDSTEYVINDIVFPASSVVWYNNKLWTATVDIIKTQNTAFNDEMWELVENSGSFLPSRTAYDEEVLTLPTGLLGDSTSNTLQFSEMVKQGDNFGHAISMSRDGSILVVSAPNADNQYFENYKGVWSPYQVYYTNDVVRYEDPLTSISSYRKLYDPRSDNDPSTDSSVVYASINQSPERDPWAIVGDSSRLPTGKVFVYQRSLAGAYILHQTITAATLDDINDTGTSEIIASGDQFGLSMDIDWAGSTLVISSPNADINFNSQGSVYIFRKDLSSTSTTFKLVQKLLSYEEFPNEFFGTSVSISQRSERIVIGAKNVKNASTSIFNAGSVTFDKNRTSFYDAIGSAGQVYVYENKDQVYLLAEKLEADLQNFESFGTAIDATNSVIVVGSPDYKLESASENLIAGQSYTITNVGTTDWYSLGVSRNITPTVGTRFTALSAGSGTGTALSTTKIGKVRVFSKDETTNSLQVIAQESKLVNLDLIKNISVYDLETNINLGSLDIVDHYKLNILGVAEQELSFKTVYDPAIYSVGTADHEVDDSQAWFSDNVGKLWWDLSTVKFTYAEQGDIAYRIGQWNSQVTGSSIDIYEWVESIYTPSEWAALSTTTEGVSLGISGTPKFVDNSVYSVKPLYNSVSGELSNTLYFYWVKNKTATPEGMPTRRISASQVSNLIASPETSGLPFIALIDTDKFLLWNMRSLLKSDNSAINIEYAESAYKINPVHTEYQLLTEGVADSLPTASLEAKWIDSLVGYDQSGNKVPDTKLSPKQRYGLSFRPRQSMFADRFSVLDAVLENVNVLLQSKPFADTISYSNLGLVDSVPIQELAEYDLVVPQYIDLETVGVVKVKQAVLVANITDGEIESITILEPGAGYRVVPPIIIQGSGIGAKAVATIDSQGKISSVTILSRGRKYLSAVVSVRQFSVLVEQDETIDNYWVIYSWDDRRSVFFKRKIQSFNTPNYWKFVDWYAAGVTPTSRIVTEISSLTEEPSIRPNTGDIIRITEFANGGWALLQKTEFGAGTILQNYNLVARENGTIEIIKSKFSQLSGIGIDTVSTYDGNFYDLQPTAELRNILSAIKEDIFIDDLRVEWNKLFFTSIRYSFVQLPAVDWAFKTSFLNAIHKVGMLDQRLNYKNDNLESYQQYIEEVKPYRTTIREYTSKYDAVEYANNAILDFDNPPAYSTEYGKIVPITAENIISESYPWQSFYQNLGQSVIAITLINAGTGYTSPPSVLIDGSGTGAVAKAYLSNGSVSGIEILSTGAGYTSAPTVRLVGGNGSSTNIATASAVLGNGLVRSLKIGIKFDRISKSGILQTYEQVEEFISPGFTSIFNLKYAPSRDKSKIVVLINSQLILTNEYSITFYKSNIDSFNLLKGKLILAVPPAAGDIITITYDRNDEYLDAANRIQKYYSPLAGMIGKEIPQLMTGVDFGGVQIQGTTFDVTGGWDALPWFTDNWDSVETLSDFYYVADGITPYVELPTAPLAGQLISIYIKRATITTMQNIDNIGTESAPLYVSNPAVYDQRPVRVDGDDYPSGSALIPTFIGDGVTTTVDLIDPATNLLYFAINEGDTLIFRPIDSDGSVIINDPNIIDTRLSGGSLAVMEGAYITATGRTVDEIIVDGDKFINVDNVPATEENVPGQVLDSVSIKLYHTPLQGAAPLQNRLYYSNGVTAVYDIGLVILESTSLLVYVDKNRVTNYQIDYSSNTVIFNEIPSAGSSIELISIGIGGANLLDYREFVSDGTTDFYLTHAKYMQTSSVLVIVNGNEVSSVYYNSSEYSTVQDRTIVQLGYTPEFGATIKIVCVGSAAGTQTTTPTLIRVNNQTIVYDGSTSILELDNFVNLEKSSASSSLIVELNGKQLVGPDTVIQIYTGLNNVVEIGKDPQLQPGTITLNDISLYINNELQPAIIVYTFNSTTKKVTINSDYLSLNDEIKIIISILSDYDVANNSLILSSRLTDTMTAGDVFDIIWFSDYPSFDIVSDQYVGGKVKYKLSKRPVDSNYLWVYNNGIRLSNNKDYDVNISRAELYLNIETSTTDIIKIIEFGNDILVTTSAYEIFKDMLNVYHFKRFVEHNVVLSKDLNYYDQFIEVNDASLLFSPIPSRNIPGVVIINKERIEYLQKTGNRLLQLRRGSLGTSIGEVYTAGMAVTDSSIPETIPYRDQQERYDFVSDGSSLLIGPLEFTPLMSNRTAWHRDTIPANYGACDQLEIFAGGTRLRKDPLDVYSEDLGPLGDLSSKILEAEFSVDGDTPYIRLTTPVAAGTRITMIRRVGKIWYDKAESTASAGVTFHKNNNPIVNFILQKTTDIPE